MTRTLRSHALALSALTLCVVTEVAHAQAIFIARRAIGRIEQMTQTAPNGNATFEAANATLGATPPMNDRVRPSPCLAGHRPRWHPRGVPPA